MTKSVNKTNKKYLHSTIEFIYEKNTPIESKSSERNKKEMENRSDKLNKQFK